MRKVLLALVSITAIFAADNRPRIRAVTVFIDVNRQDFSDRIAAAQQFLATAKAAFNSTGFEGANGRITTQPFPEWTKGMSREDATTLVRSVREAAAKARNGLDIGPAMINDNDDAANAVLLADIMAAVSVNANLIIADQNGIHWHALHEAAKLIKSLSEHSAHGDANFNFAAIAMMKPYGPYYPGSFHLGKGHAFAIAMEGANVVSDVFAKYHDPQEAERQLSQVFSKYTMERKRSHAPSKPRQVGNTRG